MGDVDEMTCETKASWVLICTVGLSLSFLSGGWKHVRLRVAHSKLGLAAMAAKPIEHMLKSVENMLNMRRKRHEKPLGRHCFELQHIIIFAPAGIGWAMADVCEVLAVARIDPATYGVLSQA